MRRLVTRPACALALILGLSSLAAPALRAETAAPLAAPAAADGPSVVAQAGRAAVRLQRDVNRAITRQLTAIRRGEEPLALWLGIGIAFLYGVAHALGPGHGKAVVASYFLSREATVLRGVAMGGQIALAHVASAIVIVVAVHFVLQASFASPVEETRALKLASYAAIAAIGLAMLWGEARRQRAAARSPLLQGAAGHGGHDHGHGDSCAACAHVQGHRSGGLLSLAIGLVPCSGAVLILVYALANGIVLAGVLMTLAIALGMGLTLAALGVASVYARRGAIRAAGGPAGSRRPRLARAAALGGPLAISLLGIALFAASW